jgi:DNA-nicking Smr family endonuclease
MNKKTRTPPISADDITLFRASMADVTPLRRAVKIEHPRKLPQPVPAQRLLDDLETLKDSLSDRLPWDPAAETGEELNYARPGVGIQAVRKLRRGHWVTQAELDLHGLRVAEARQLLAEFLNLCARRGLRCVRIVHGKGLGSKNREPVLKQKVGRWLMQRDEILAFCQARPVDGGGGAVVVLLKAG